MHRLPKAVLRGGYILSKPVKQPGRGAGVLVGQIGVVIEILCQPFQFFLRKSCYRLGADAQQAVDSVMSSSGIALPLEEGNVPTVLRLALTSLDRGR